MEARATGEFFYSRGVFFLWNVYYRHTFEAGLVVIESAGTQLRICSSCIP